MPKGEWTAIEVNISGANDVYIRQGRDHIAKVFGSSTIRKRERARLIAAAPEMLEALKERQRAEAIPTGIHARHERDAAFERANRLAEAAIAKAEGADDG